MSEIILTIEGVDPVELYGENNVKLNLLKNAFPDVQFVSRGNSLKITGDKKESQQAKSRFELMVRMLKEHKELSYQQVEDLMKGDNPFENRIPVDTNPTTATVHGREGKIIRAKTKKQKNESKKGLIGF